MLAQLEAKGGKRRRRAALSSVVVAEAVGESWVSLTLIQEVLNTIRYFHRTEQPGFESPASGELAERLTDEMSSMKRAIARCCGELGTSAVTDTSDPPEG